MYYLFLVIDDLFGYLVIFGFLPFLILFPLYMVWRHLKKKRNEWFMVLAGLRLAVLSILITFIFELVMIEGPYAIVMMFILMSGPMVLVCWIVGELVYWVDKFKQRKRME